jgi:hypothetical protein
VKLDSLKEVKVCDGCESAFRAGSNTERHALRDALREMLPGWSCRICGSSITGTDGKMVLHASDNPCDDCIKVTKPMIDRLERE